MLVAETNSYRFEIMKSEYILVSITIIQEPDLSQRTSWNQAVEST